MNVKMGITIVIPWHYVKIPWKVLNVTADLAMRVMALNALLSHVLRMLVEHQTVVVMKDM
jgi:hypothetical protein